MLWNDLWTTATPWRDLASAAALRGPARFPAVRAHLKEDEVLVEALLPGVSREGLTLAIEEDELVLEGELPGTENARVLRRERSTGRFRRRLQLPFRIDPEGAHAELANGLLRVRMKRRPDSGPRKIDIKTKGDEPHAS
jgi:HSP20 family protein